MFGFKFLGKTRIPHLKNTSDKPAIRMAPPKEILIPVSQHIGEPATPIVKVGDEVKVGQLIAEASGNISSPVYASVSGKVTKIDTYLRHNGTSIPAIRIEGDGLMTALEGLATPTITDFDSFIEAVKNSGVVGLGGAGFPTHAKLAAAKDQEIHTIVINGAECEPYITCDTRIMLDESESLFLGVSLLETYIPSLKSIIFGIENNKPECIEEMARIFQDNPKVSVVPLPTLYPQGAEKVILHNTTGIVLPEGKLPKDVGALVINVASLSAVAKYVETGMPLVEKCITVDGSAIANPMNVIVPIGTSIGDVIEFTGGFSDEVGKVIIGGPMMGTPACSLDEPVIKTTNALTALNMKDSVKAEATACIHCGRCVAACPYSLNPTAFSKALNIENVDERMARLEEYSLNLCMECGSCTFVCPARRPLVQNIRLAKNALKVYKAHKSDLK